MPAIVPSDIIRRFLASALSSSPAALFSARRLRGGDASASAAPLCRRGGDASLSAPPPLRGGELSLSAAAAGLRGGEASGLSCRCLRGGEASGLSCRCMRGGEASGLSCRCLRGGEASGLSCRCLRGGEASAAAVRSATAQPLPSLPCLKKLRSRSATSLSRSPSSTFTTTGWSAGSTADDREALRAAYRVGR
jgi:hypothetical protein